MNILLIIVKQYNSCKTQRILIIQSKFIMVFLIILVKVNIVLICWLMIYYCFINNKMTLFFDNKMTLFFDNKMTLFFDNKNYY